MKYIINLNVVVAVLVLSACSAKVPTSMLEGTQWRSKISIQFQDFPVDTICRVVTPDGSVEVDSYPSAIEYPSKYRDAPVTCTTTSGDVYDVLMTSVLPESFKVAGLTAYKDGFLVATISAESLFQTQNEEGVMLRK